MTKIKATNDNAWCIKEQPIAEVNGIKIPDSAQAKVHKGKLVTVGSLVSDKSIKAGATAIFNKTSGTTIEEKGIEYIILRQVDIIGIEDESSK